MQAQVERNQLTQQLDHVKKLFDQVCGIGKKKKVWILLFVGRKIQGKGPERERGFAQ